MARHLVVRHGVRHLVLVSRRGSVDRGCRGADGRSRPGWVRSRCRWWRVMFGPGVGGGVVGLGVGGAGVVGCGAHGRCSG
ncbi:hypothetical protein LT493_21920 [Streptomyces tricolor]|nr:hypothetical protein [Streptomyces tricolor]